MKYVIFGSEYQPRIYMGNDTMHANLAKADMGRPVSAGHFKKVYLDWDGKEVTKRQAKKYVMEYGV